VREEVVVLDIDSKVRAELDSRVDGVILRVDIPSPTFLTQQKLRCLT
jgi:hypothetical protein